MNNYIVPTNEQLARFLVVYIPPKMGLDIHPDAHILEHLLNTKPEVREMALEHHRKFQAQINELEQRREAGTLPCSYIRANGKQCPNHNQPGSYYCGLHIDEEE